MAKAQKLDLIDFAQVIPKSVIADLLSEEIKSNFAVEALEADTKAFVTIRETASEAEFKRISPFEIEEIKKVEYQKGYDAGISAMKEELQIAKKQFHTLHALIEQKLSMILDQQDETAAHFRKIFLEILLTSIETIWSQHKFANEKITAFVEEMIANLNPENSIKILVHQILKPLIEASINPESLKKFAQIEILEDSSLKEGDCNISWRSGYAQLSLEAIKIQCTNLIKKHFC